VLPPDDPQKALEKDGKSFDPSGVKLLPFACSPDNSIRADGDYTAGFQAADNRVRVVGHSALGQHHAMVSAGPGGKALFFATCIACACALSMALVICAARSRRHWLSWPIAVFMRLERTGSIDRHGHDILLWRSPVVDFSCNAACR
jgi:hypothetical protein